MTVTVLGWILLPAGLALALLPSRRPLLLSLAALAPFTAAAVVNVAGPGFGVQPAFYLGTLWMGRVGLSRLMAGGRLRLTPSQKRVVADLLLFALAAAASVTLITWYGSDTVVTHPSGGQYPLRFGSQNVTQVAYIVFVVLYAVSLVAADLSPEDVRAAVRTLILSGVFVALWGWMQLVLFRLGIAYPAFLFNNSASWRQSFQQMLSSGVIKRMTSVAPEPSMLARFLLIPAFLCFYGVYDGEETVLSRRSAILLSMFFTVTLMATTSSTALVGLVGGLAVLLLVVLAGRGHAGRRADVRRIFRLLVLLAVMLPLASVLVAHFWLRLSLAQTLQILNILVFSKLSGTSGTERVAGAIQGLHLFVTHPLLGVGWGSDRTFDLLTNLLAGTGVIGTGLFLVAHAQVIWSGWKVSSIRRPRALGRWAPIPAALILTLLVAFLGKAAAEPDLIYLDYWTVFGLLGATLGWPARLGGDTPVP